MSKLKKRLAALLDGKDIPWHKIETVLKEFDARVEPPTGGGSHYQVFFRGYEPLRIPVHNGRIKPVYSKKLAKVLNEIAKKLGRDYE